MLTSLDLENIDLESQNLHLEDLLYRHNYPLNFVLLTFIRAEIAWRASSTPPLSRASNSRTLSRVCRKNGIFPTSGSTPLDSSQNYGVDSVEFALGIFRSDLPSVGAMCRRM